MKIFLTGDNHFGKKYDRYPDVKETLINGRFDALERMVCRANEEKCDLFAVSGDLFDNINTIKVADVKRVIDILGLFSGSMIILPGNHDYYTGEEKVWKDFEHALDSKDYNITLVKEFRPYEYEFGEEKVTIYPAFCQSKHSKENNLGWIKSANICESGVINVGLAHGAIGGITPDMNEEYFLMTESELSSIPMDVWLIGHTHIPYPNVLEEGVDTSGYRIYNAGTHEQTDLHNNTDGNGFIISVEKKDSDCAVTARRFISGKVRFRDAIVKVKPETETSLRDGITKAISEYDDNTIVRVNISGSVRQNEYEDREKIYKSLLGRFLSYERDDRELSEEITVEKIRTEYAETSFAAQFMEALIDNPTELQMAYQLLQECKGN